jgi:hypothetical protein
MVPYGGHLAIIPPYTRRVTGPAAERYLRLGLRLGRHADDVVDAYFGPPELLAEVEAEPLTEPRELVAAADALLVDLPDSWLRDQVTGLRTYAGILAGADLRYADEVQGCYGVRPARTDESVFAAAHARLAELLPGPGPLAGRYQQWRDSMLVPAAQIEPVFAAVMAEARAQTRDLVDLPDGEDVVLEMVRDVPWQGYNFYAGDLRGRVAINVGLSMSAIDVLDLALHETYPGHQAERACKERLLVRGRGMLAETLVLAPTPQSVVSEGLARLGPRLMLSGKGGGVFAGLVHAAGVEFDLAHALAVDQASEPLRWAEVNAALLLHEAEADPAAARAYLKRWALLTDELADHLVRFISDPASRSYVIAYPAGLELCRAYVGGQPDRFRRLLTEQVRVADLIAARDASLPPAD